MEQAEFLARQQARDAEAEAKTAKNRARRQKRKGGKRGEVAAEPTTNGGTGLKRKLAGGAAVVFKRPGEESDGEDGEEAPTEDVAVTQVAPDEPRAIPVAEQEIVIHDDE